MGNFRVNLTILLIVFMAQSCAYAPRKTTILDCIQLAGEVITAYCLKPDNKGKDHANKTKEEIRDEITREYVAKKQDEFRAKGIVY